MKKEDQVDANNALVELQRLLRVWSITEDEHSDPAWREKVLVEYQKFANAIGIVVKDSDPFGPLDFVANILYGYDCQGRGTVSIRWAKLSAVEQETFRQQAINTVASWAHEELKLQQFGTITPLVPRRPGR